MKVIKTFKPAFTLGELVAALIVITIIVLVTIPITAKKMEKVNKYAYFMAYETMRSISANVISQTSYSLNETSYTAKIFCGEIADLFNVDTESCSVATSSAASAAVSGDFSKVTPHIVLSNGLQFYIASSLSNISQLSDASQKDRVGFTVYVDINGKAGHNKLYTDVFPFYLLASGKTVPGYKQDGDEEYGANSTNYLSLNVIYDSFSGNNRSVELLLRETSFKNAACATGYVDSSTYCGTSTKYNLCKKSYHDCRFIVNKPFRIF